MNLQETYKEKAEAELELAHARVAEFKAKIEGFAAETRVNYAEQVDHLEKTADDTKKKLKELGEAGEDVREKLKDGVESALRSLSATIKDIADKFKD